jgi:signal transduction histidine kinase
MLIFINNVQSFDFSLILIITIVIILLFILIIIVLLFISQKRYFKHREQVRSIEQAFSQELLQAQLEIQEQTLHHVSEEIHDNIGQVLSFVKLNLGTIKGLSDDEKNDRIGESKDLVAQAISDLRDLSRSLSKDNISTRGLLQTIRDETERIGKSGLVNINLHIDGDVFSLGEQRELVLFRILQESVNNTLKHSGADNLKICLQYCSDLFTLTLSDNGSGFDIGVAESKNGSGLKNIRNRANLIGAEVGIISVVGQGSEIRVSLNPFDKKTYADGNYSGSPG